MQSDTRPADPPSAFELASLVTADLVSVVSSARRRASRDGDQNVDTAHLLHSLLEADMRVRGAFTSAQVARLLGYLVQRSIGFGLRWRGCVECSLQPQPAAEPSELTPAVNAAPAVSGAAMVSFPAGELGPRLAARWSPAAWGALNRAIARAHGRGRPKADGVDLLVALVANQECRAMDVLRFAGVDATKGVAALAE